ncbi:MAG: glycosyltransferase family 9 protein [Nibricoccus sp.]
MSPAVQKLYAFSLARYFDWLRVVKGKPLALFFRDGGIGDILCTFPAAARLADNRPNAYKIYCTNPAFVDLPKMLGRFDRVMGIRSNDLVAAAVKRHTVYRFRYPDEEPNGSSNRYLADEFAERFDLPAGLAWPKLELGPFPPKVAALFPADDKRPVVCIHTGPTWVVREWPLDRWDTLVARLKETLGCRVLHVGASRHFREGERKERPVAGAEDCRDIFSLRETIQIISKAKLLVGIDSGMIHAAVALGLPVVGVFGATSGKLRLPPQRAVAVTAALPCLGCHHRHPRLHWQSGCPHNAACMQGIDTDEVFKNAASFLYS